MNRLQIVKKYMTLSTKVSNQSKYQKAQKLHKKIIANEDKKIKENIK